MNRRDILKMITGAIPLAAFRAKLEAMTDAQLVAISPLQTATPTVICPLTPTARQAEFLALNSEEALYGGAVGGGKSEGLLMWLAQPTYLPDYAGIVFRRTYTQLEGNNGLIHKSHKMYRPMGATYNATQRKWTFPTGSTIELGHLPQANSHENYQGRDWIRIGFDELTHFLESQYTYMFSRKRKKVGYPIRSAVRATANPGGVGHAWVKARFITQQAMLTMGQLDCRAPTPIGTVFWPTQDRAFVPARLSDNQHLDIEEYEKSLGHLPELTRRRLMAGDWGAAEGLVIPEEHLRYFQMAGEILKPQDEPLSRNVIDCRTCRRFATIDTAGTSRQKAEEERGKPPSWSVVAIWDYWPAKDYLFLRHVWRDQVDWNGLKATASQVLRAWNCRKALIENAHVGPPLGQELQGIQVEFVGPTIAGMRDGHQGAKLDRAVASGLLSRLKDGKLFIPEDQSGWVGLYIGELTAWSGLPDETCDQIDVSSYAAYHTKKSGQAWGGVIKAR